jgi:hypothetical protein
MNLTMVDRSSHTHTGFGKWVRDIEVYLDVSCRSLGPLLVEDVEGDISSPSVVFIALQWQQ